MTKCGEWVSDGRLSYRCVRDAVEDGMCKQHAAGARRRKANEAKRVAKRQAENAQVQAVEDKIRRLSALGVEASRHVRPGSFAVSGRVVVDPDVLLALLETAADLTDELRNVSERA